MHAHAADNGVFIRITKATTEMIKTRRKVRPRWPPLIVMLTATLGGGADAPATSRYLGRPAAR